MKRFIDAELVVRSVEAYDGFPGVDVVKVTLEDRYSQRVEVLVEGEHAPQVRDGYELTLEKVE